MLIEHAKKAIVGRGLALVIPFLDMADDLMCVVELEGEKRIDNLEVDSVNRSDVAAEETPNLERRSSLGIAEIRDVLVNEK